MTAKGLGMNGGNNMLLRSSKNEVLKQILEIQTQGELDLPALVHGIGDLPESGN